MRANGIGCGGWILLIIIIAIIWNIGGCIIGKIWDGTQEVLSERHAKQEIADAKAREQLALEEAEKALAEAKASEERRAAAEVAERRKREEVARREAAQQKEAMAKREEAKADKLRTFALRDAPVIWKAHEQLKEAIVEQDVRIKDLAATLKEFDKNPETDSDYLAICAARGEMETSLKGIRRKLEEAYLAYCRFKATPSHKEYEELMRKALDDGMQAADAATRKFEQMKVDK